MNLKKFIKTIILALIFTSMLLVCHVTPVEASVYDTNDITFNPVYYANKYVDLKNAFGYDANLLRNHFMIHGVREGRVASIEFDVKYYLDNNGDLQKVFGKTNYEAAYNHFLTYGIREGRITSSQFDVRHYLANYGDLQKAFGKTNYEAAYNHYLIYGIKEKRTAVSNSSHIYGSAVVTKQATCTRAGEKVSKCTACGASKVEKIAALGHKEVTIKGKDATCTVKGITDGKQCSVCKKVLVQQKEIPIKEHKYVKDTDATCTSNETGHCEYPGCTVYAEADSWEKEGTINPDGHNYENIESPLNKAATCTATGKQMKECTLCTPETEGHAVLVDTDMIAHTPNEGTIIGEISGPGNIPTCTENKIKIIDCSVCGTEIKRETIEATEHTVGEVVYSKNPTCKVAGRKVYICDDCGYTVSEYPAATGIHTPDAPVETAAPTCTTKGTETISCSVCGDLIEEREKDCIPHTTSTAPGAGTVTKVATCSDKGSEDVVCDDCGTTFARDIEKVPHAFATYRIVKAGSCTEDRVEAQICQVCGETKTNTTEAQGHDYQEDTPATCTTNSTGHCKNAGCEYSEANSMEQEGTKGHIYVKDTNATCTTNETGHCSNAGCTEYSANNSWEKEDTALEHVYVKDTDATCTTNETGHCSNAGCTEYSANNSWEKEDTALGHEYVKDTDATCTADETGHCSNAGCPTYSADDSWTKADTALGHEYVKDTDATCTDDEKGHCTREGCAKSADNSITKENTKGHEFEVVTPAECGSAAYIKCKNCNAFDGTDEEGTIATAESLADVLTDEQKDEYKALEHSYDHVKNATCFEAGEDKCSLCDETKPVSILSHDGVEGFEYIITTRNGLKTTYCPICDVSKVETVTE